MLTVDEILAASDNGTIIEIAQAEAERSQREMKELRLRRQTVIQKTVERLRGYGVDARVARILERVTPMHGMLCEAWYFDARGTYRHSLEFFSIDPSHQTRTIGARLHDGALLVWHGTYELLHRDGRAGIVVSTEGNDDEAAHRRNVAHLRRVARREGFRVSVADRDAALLDPMNTVLHTGTVLTALAFIAGVDLTHPVEEPQS